MTAPGTSGSRPLALRIKDAIARGTVRLVALLPLSATHALGTGLGWLVAHWPNRQRRNALINIGLCLPELTREDQRALRDRNLVEFGKTYFEIGYLWLRPKEQDLSEFAKRHARICKHQSDRDHWLEGYRKAGFHV